MADTHGFSFESDESYVMAAHFGPRTSEDDSCLPARQR